MKRAATKNEDTQTTEPMAKRLLVSIDDDMLHVQIPIAPHPSTSGRSTIVATTEGCRFADCKYQGRDLRINAVATYKGR
jgi:hypothetical protein